MLITSNCATYVDPGSGTGANNATFTYDVRANPEPIIKSVFITGIVEIDSNGVSRFFDDVSVVGGDGLEIVHVRFTTINGSITNSSATSYYTGLTTSLQGYNLIINIAGNSIVNPNNNNTITTSAGDNYVVYLNGCQGSPGAPSSFDPSSFTRAQVVLTRANNLGFGFGGAGGGFNDGFTGGCSGCACFVNNSCGNVRVPIVTISGQTTFDGEYLADILFTICDEYQYYKCKPLKSCCKVNFIKAGQVLQTQFRTCGIELQKVVKGPNNLSLREKLLNIYNQFMSILGPSFNAFYENFILYGMAKYILARVLYGDFNLDYLLKSFNKQFLNDLGNSRFCAFLELFEDCNSNVYGFNQFFKSGKKEYSESIYNFRKVNKGCGCK